MAACINHSDSMAMARCSGCSEPFCANCVVTVKGRPYCAGCKSMVVKGKVLPPIPAIAVQPCEEATEALKFALLSIFCFGFITGPMAVMKGIKARREIADAPDLSGEGKATAAIILGVTTTALNIVGAIVKASHH